MSEEEFEKETGEAKEEEVSEEEYRETPEEFEEYKPPKQIVPRPSEEVSDIVEPLVELYMQKRGLSDRSQALVKLVNIMSRTGFQPPREIQNIRQYIRMMNETLDSIPDYPETLPTKSALATQTALTANKMLKKAMLDEEDDFGMKDTIRLATKMAMVMKVLDSVLGAKSSESNDKLEKTLDSIMKRLEKLETEKERDQLIRTIEDRLKYVDEKIKPIEETVNKLVDKLDQLSTVKAGSPEESALLREIKELKDALTKKEYKETLEEIRNIVASIPEKIGESTVKGELGLDAIDKALSIYDKLERKIGKRPPEGTPDWKTTAVSTFADVVKEVLPKVVSSGEEGEASREKTLQDVIDMKVLEYALGVKKYGSGVLNIKRCATDLGLTEQQVKDSLARLKERGLIQYYIRQREETEEEKVEEKPKEVKEIKEEAKPPEEPKKPEGIPRDVEELAEYLPKKPKKKGGRK